MWFVAPYGSVEQKENSHAYVAPHIYDADGQLVWSGSEKFQRFNTFSFKVSRVANEDMLTLLYPHNNEGRIFDNTYEDFASIHTGRDGFGHNMHEFQIVDDGKRALFIVGSGGRSTANADKLGVDEGRCRLVYQGIEERDIETGEVTFAWSAQDKIDPDESYMFENDPTEICEPSNYNNADYMYERADLPFTTLFSPTNITFLAGTSIPSKSWNQATTSSPAGAHTPSTKSQKKAKSHGA